MIYTMEQIKQIVRPIAEQYGLRAVYVFGSYATGRAGADSDIDLLVDTTGTTLTSLMALGALYCDLEKALQKPIDLVTVASLEQSHHMESDHIFREQVEKERVSIYAAA